MPILRGHAHGRGTAGFRFAPSPAAGREALTDGQLLDLFLKHHDEGAFTTLLRRHGPMVLGVCRRVLGHGPDSEDAFQATFLVLVRRARSLDRRGSLAAWLYGVAQRISTRARADSHRRRDRERQMSLMNSGLYVQEATAKDLRPLLDVELARLPAKYRAPLILCYLEGKTHEQAAHELGWPTGSMSRRLTRARELLRGLLTKRGFTLSAATFAVALEEAGASAAVPVALGQATLRSALLTATGKLVAAASLQAVQLAGRMTPTLWITKGKMVALTALVATIVASSAAVKWEGNPNESDIAAPLKSAFKPSTIVPQIQAAKAPQAPEPSPRPAEPPPPEPQEEDVAQKENDPLSFLDRPLPSGAIVQMGRPSVSIAGQVMALAISQDNSMLAYAFVRSNLTKIRVIRTKSPATILNEISFNKPIKPIKKLSFSPNGKTLADDQGRQWNVADRRPQAIENLRNGITGYAISPDGSQAAMIRDKAIDLVSASDQKALKTVKVKLDRPFDVTFSPNGKWLAILGEGDEISEGQVRERVVQVCLYEIAHDRAKVWSVGGNKAQSPSFVSIAFDDSSQLLAFGIEKAPINVYQVDQRNEPRLKLLTRLNVKGLTQKIEIFNGGKNLIAGSNDGSVTVWDLKANKEIRRIGPFGHGTKDGYSFAASPDKEWFLRAAPIDPNQSPINAPQSSLQMWSLKNVQESRREARHVGIIRNLVFSPDGQSLLTSSPDGTVRLWDTKSGSETATLDRKGYENLQNIPIGFNSEGHVLVAERQVVEVCSADSLKVVSTIGEFRSSVLGIALAPKGDKLAMVGLDQLPELWDTKDKGKHTALVGQKVGLKGGQCVAFSQDGKHLAVGTWPNQSLFQDREGLISIWDVEKGTLRDSLGGHPQRTRLGVFALSFRPDSRRIVYSEDDTLYLCDIVTGVQIQRFRGHTDTICSMALSPDGRLLASGSLDNTLRLWEVRTGKEIRRFEGHSLPVYSLAFSPDGRRLASGSADTTAIVWNVSAPIKLDRLMIGDICPGDTVELRSLWIELAGSEPDRAYQAQTALVRGAEISVPFLAQRLIKVKAPSQEEIDHLLTDLASEFPWIWDEARIKLIALGEVVEGPVRAALDKKPSPDLKEHLQDVLDALKDPANHLPSPDELRQLRAVAVLEHIGGAEAKAILKELATGYAKALVTRDAAESLERLAKRP